LSGWRPLWRIVLSGRTRQLNKLRQFLPAALLLLGFGFVLRTRAQMALPLAKPLSTVLAGLGGGYHVEEQKVSDEERRVAGMSQYSARVYRTDSAVAFTTLVSYYERQSQGKTIHSPRNCLPGAGWEVLNGGTRVVQSDGVPYTVNRFLLKNGPAVSVAYYWYQGRGRVAANEYRVKWNLLRDAALVGHTEEALVRIVIPVTTPPARADTARMAPDSAAMLRVYAHADSLASGLAAQMIRDVRAALPGGPAAARS
jgi:EpsI family protein